MISIEECKHIEELSKLEFTDEERAKFINEFSAILEFASIISNAECDNQKFINTINLNNLREDEAKEGLSQDEVVSNAPVKKKGCFVVPKMMD